MQKTAYEMRISDWSSDVCSSDLPDCAPGLPYVLPDAGDGQALLLELDPARVQAVDYLLAEGHDQAMSRWGPSLLRLVVCAPGRPRGPDCRLDLQYHLLLSFRAFVDHVPVSSWPGLTGPYPRPDERP